MYNELMDWLMAKIDKTERHILNRWVWGISLLLWLCAAGGIFMLVQYVSQKAVPVTDSGMAILEIEFIFSPPEEQ